MSDFVIFASSNTVSFDFFAVYGLDILHRKSVYILCSVSCLKTVILKQVLTSQMMFCGNLEIEEIVENFS